MKKTYQASEKFNEFWSKSKHRLMTGTALWASLAAWDYCQEDIKSVISAKDTEIERLNQKLKQIKALVK